MNSILLKLLAQGINKSVTHFSIGFTVLFIVRAYKVKGSFECKQGHKNTQYHSSTLPQVFKLFVFFSLKEGLQPHKGKGRHT